MPATNLTVRNLPVLVLRVLTHSSFQALVKLCQQQLVRCFPAGSRVDSDNQDPAVPWAMGCQLVPLNYQTADIGLHLHHGKFALNGGCGLVPRPAFLNDLHADFSPTWTVAQVLERPQSAVTPARRLVLTVISAQHLEPSAEAKAAQPDMARRVTDPYVHVEVGGRAACTS